MEPLYIIQEEEVRMTNTYMTDIHCHILPGIDDGAQNPDMSGASVTSSRQP